MPILPPSNLPPNSQPWGRDVSRKQDEFSFAINKLDRDTKNAFSAINGTVKQLSEQILNQVGVAGDSVLLFSFTLYDSPIPSVGAYAGFEKPSWATKALVTAVSTGFFVASSSTAEAIVQVSIDGHSGMGVDMPRKDGVTTSSFSATNTFTYLLDPCPETFTCSSVFFVNDASLFLSGEGNRASYIGATVLFTR